MGSILIVIICIYMSVGYILWHIGRFVIRVDECM